MHLIGAGEALKVMMVITGLAIFAIIATAVALFADFDVALLFDIAVTDAQGASTFMPMGWYGILGCIAFRYVVISCSRGGAIGC